MSIVQNDLAKKGTLRKEKQNVISRLNQLREMTPTESPRETPGNHSSDLLHAGIASEEIGERDIDGNNNNNKDDDGADSIEYNVRKNYIQRVSLPRPAVEEVKRESRA